LTFFVSCQIAVAKLIKLGLLDWQQLISISATQALPPTQATPRSRTSKTKAPCNTTANSLQFQVCNFGRSCNQGAEFTSDSMDYDTITQHSMINELERSVASNRSTEARRSSNAHDMQILGMEFHWAAVAGVASLVSCDSSDSSIIAV
jgi:hypothetical protein